jgi:predicted transcriptional regulator of viral defense system
MCYNSFTVMSKYQGTATLEPGPTTGIKRSRDLEAQGLSRTTIARLVQRGELERIARGVYADPKVAVGAHQRLAEIALLAPHASICLLSALEYHNLTTQLPFETWIAVPARSHKPKLEGVRVHFFDAAHFDLGLETVMIDGVPVRISNPARTVADCFKYRHKIGLDVALEALKQGFLERRFSSDELWQMAKANRVQNVITPYLEMLVSA